jgi:hypothetical protein
VILNCRIISIDDASKVAIICVTQATFKANVDSTNDMNYWLLMLCLVNERKEKERNMLKKKRWKDVRKGVDCSYC